MVFKPPGKALEVPRGTRSVYPCLEKGSSQESETAGLVSIAAAASRYLFCFYNEVLRKTLLGEKRGLLTKTQTKKEQKAILSTHGETEAQRRIKLFQENSGAPTRTWVSKSQSELFPIITLPLWKKWGDNIKHRNVPCPLPTGLI